MTAQDIIRYDLGSAEFVGLGYLEDMTDAELLHRPCPGANHINWQVGHLIVAENHHVNLASPGAMPPLPAGFAEKYSKETACVDDPTKLLTKVELIRVYKEQRAGTLAALAKIDPAALDKESGVPYAPTVGALFALHGGHWMMHSGQWAVIRRQLGRKPMF